MARLASNFNWRKSPAHIDLLGKFIEPRDVAQVLNWRYVKGSLEQDPKEVIENFTREEMLVACELDELMNCAFKTFDLKKMAKEEGVKTTGTKAELIERLIAADRFKIEKVTSKIKVLKCTPQAKELVESYEKGKQEALISAKQKAFELLLNGDAKEAYKVFRAYNQEHPNVFLTAYHGDYFPDSFVLKKLSFILTSAPKVLGEITPTDLASLRAAACMPILWREESAEHWLPETFTAPVKSNKVAINYLKCNAEIRENVARFGDYIKKVKFIFDEYDIDSCALCQQLNEKVYGLLDVPELPFENCTSETGCKCKVEAVRDTGELEVRRNPIFTVSYDGEALEPEDGYDSEADENDVGNTEDDAFTKLSQLKKMVDNRLISDEEYQKKKSEILSRM